MTNKRDLVQYLLGSFPVTSVKGNELKFPCPNCGRSNFYFNVAKQVGKCHHAKCSKVTFLSDITQLLGTTPETAGYIPILDNTEKSYIAPCHIKGKPWLIIGDELRDQWAVDTLINRGLTEKDITRFAIQATDHWIYVPVYEHGKLENYIGRRIDRRLDPIEGFASEKLGRRYDYYKGVSIHNFIFGWDQARNWTQITLVENIFNSIWLRDKIHSSTAFGSYISQIQINKIIQSKIIHVTLLWDEGAERSAQKATISLQNAGIEARYIKIKGQPDNYTLEEIIKICQN